MHVALVLALTVLALTQAESPKLPPHLSSFVAQLKEEIATTAEKYAEPRERATRILATHIRLLSELPIADRKLLSTYFDGNSLLEVVDPHNYRSVVVHQNASFNPHP